MPAGFTATEIQTLLTGAGLILAVGFLAQLLFEKTRIPDILILLAIGYLVGPLTGWVSVDRLAPYAPFLGAIAVAFILFDGGLDFELDKMLGQLGPASGLILLILYGGSEYFRASGGLAVLTMAMVLANSERFRQFFAMKSPAVDTRSLKATHTEFTFFIRTFFFVYAGLFLPAKALPAAEIGLLCVALAGILLSRYLGSAAFARLAGRGTPERLAYSIMMPRGLIVAVLAGVPAAHAIPGTEPFARVAAFVIVLTNVVMSVGVVLLDRHYARQQAA